eukprot:CAMPEP_0204345794 /NCGR_PEP_ID=MMETSP0469-20131031/26673_1 /ASSEMBLY_ACC=CAM_ASM_000384 /TAXON_ID=2969 /ORGANISM="Oxyrrhis marina" /LENGTH=44 /DNA_ID= /DNA_START= /DNA_END= /DNA_ORIENTATION=
MSPGPLSRPTLRHGTTSRSTNTGGLPNWGRPKPRPDSGALWLFD